jgi:hypothetical protein
MDSCSVDLLALVHGMKDLLTSTLGADAEILIRFPSA